MKCNIFRYLVILVLGVISFSSCSDLYYEYDEDENYRLNRRIEGDLPGSWIATCVTDEYGEPLLLEDNRGVYQVMPEDFGFLRFESGRKVCYTSSNSFLDIEVDGYAVVKDQQLRVGDRYFPVVWDEYERRITLKCKYYYDSRGNYFIYFVTFERI